MNDLNLLNNLNPSQGHKLDAYNKFDDSVDFEDFASDRAGCASEGLIEGNGKDDEEIFNSLTDNLLAAEVVSVEGENNGEDVAIARGS